jgi:hypothetical protein
MAQYQVIIDTNMLQYLFSKDEGLAKLAEQVLNQILKAQASKHEGQNLTNEPMRGRDIGTDVRKVSYDQDRQTNFRCTTP